jgi:glycerol-3-phosphate dehydrogenase
VVGIDHDEIDYLCRAANRYVAREITPADIVWSYAGVRPLYDDGNDDASAVTRDYVLDLQGDDGRPPVLSVFGGKITTFRRLAGHALDRLAPFFAGMGPAWTHAAPLPGGDLPEADFDAFLAEWRRRAPWLPAVELQALARRHGTRLARLLDGAAARADLGQDFGAGLYAREVEWFRREEWAEAPEDVLWRRTKVGLHLTRPQREALAEAFAR